jgi:hypothetical protein
MEKSNKMQQCIKILLFHIQMKLNMFRATLLHLVRFFCKNRTMMHGSTNIKLNIIL